MHTAFWSSTRQTNRHDNVQIFLYSVRDRIGIYSPNQYVNRSQLDPLLCLRLLLSVRELMLTISLADLGGGAPPLGVPILSFWHTKFLKHNRLGSPHPLLRGPHPRYGKSWIRHCISTGTAKNEPICCIFSDNLCTRHEIVCWMGINMLFS